MSGFNLADLFEVVVDTVPEREALVAGDRRLTYADLDVRANRLANHLRAAGIGPGDHVGLQLVNGSEYLEGMLAAFKLRAVPVNVNYRYTSDELHYLFENADLVALVYHRRFGPAVVAASDRLPLLRHTLVVEDGTDEPSVSGSATYEQALQSASERRPGVEGRSGEDLYIAYTGGTTGMPKGVMWHHEDIFFAALGGGDPMMTGSVITSPEELVERLGGEFVMVMLPIPPFMHVSAHWGALTTLYSGGKVVVDQHGHFDPDSIWRLVQAERVNTLTIVGDAMGRPLVEALETAAEAATPYDTSSLFVIGSGGAMLSASTKDRMSAMLPSAFIVDGFGSSETGVLGTQATMAGSGPATRLTLPPSPDTTVLDTGGRPVTPGSGATGRLARRGHMPIGYYKDPQKTSLAFVTVDGVRWALPGDMAVVEADGTVVVLGRDSQCINTGGEKVYPEEVESVLKLHPHVADTIVVGLPDERWGERVVAVVQPRPGTSPRIEDLQTIGHEHLAGYKVPRQVCLVDEVVRTPAGKPDYVWARQAAARVTAGR